MESLKGMYASLLGGTDCSQNQYHNLQNTLQTLYSRSKYRSMLLFYTYLVGST